MYDKLIQMGREKVLLDEKGLKGVLKEGLAIPISHLSDLENMVLVGIYTRGVYLAQRIRRFIRQVHGVDLPLGEIDINLYRDDFVRRFDFPQVRQSRIPDVQDKVVVLVDDVLFTGRTVRAALDAILDVGRPSAVRLAVLISRPGREMPICPDVVGMEVDPGQKRIYVELKEVDGRDRVILR